MWLLRPQTNRFRIAYDLSGVWAIRFDPDDVGRAAGWSAGVPDAAPIAVPGRWNDQLVGVRDELVVPTPWYSDRRGVGYAAAPARRAAHVVRVEPDRPDPGEVVGDPEPIRLGTQEPHACSLPRIHR